MGHYVHGFINQQSQSVKGKLFQLLSGRFLSGSASVTPDSPRSLTEEREGAGSKSLRIHNTHSSVQLRDPRGSNMRTVQEAHRSPGPWCRPCVRRGRCWSGRSSPPLGAPCLMRRSSRNIRSNGFCSCNGTRPQKQGMDICKSPCSYYFFQIIRNSFRASFLTV